MNHTTALTLAMRQASNLMRLSALCGATACRRARACRGEPRDCLARCAPLVPQDAREGVKAMFDGWERGLPFDDLLDEAEDEIEALGNWQEAVARTYPRCRPPAPLTSSAAPGVRSPASTAPAGRR